MGKSDIIIGHEVEVSRKSWVVLGALTSAAVISGALWFQSEFNLHWIINPNLRNPGIWISSQTAKSIDGPNPCKSGRQPYDVSFFEAGFAIYSGANIRVDHHDFV